MQNNKIENREEIQRAIINVIAFFDMFDYPMTDFEIWQYLDYECDFSDVRNILINEPLDCINTKNGFYFLKGRQDIIITRMRRYNYANRKIKKTMSIIRLFKFIPWIKMIGIGNIIGSNNMRDNSDIDLFIITEKKRVWITRLFCVGIAKLLRIRPTAEEQRDKICLSFYISEDVMNIKNMMLNEDKICIKENNPDNYFIYWLAGIVPLYNVDDSYEKFILENNWLKYYLPNWKKIIIHEQLKVQRINSLIYRDVIDMLIGGIESNIKRWQCRIMPDYLARSINVTDGVVVNDHIIKLHYNDRRREFRDRYRRRLNILKS